MLKKTILSALLCVLTAVGALSQTESKPEIKNPKKEELSAETRKDAVAMLRETAADVGNLRTAENRISFNAEIAGLMWFHEEKQARSMFQSVIVDFKQMMTQLDAQMNAMNITASENEYYGGFLSGGSNPKAQLTRKFYKAMSVRHQIALALAEHDAPLAYEFFTESVQTVSNAELRAQMGTRDSYIEARILEMAAEQDVDKALEIGRKTLAKGISYELVNVLKKIYEKDADKGIKFGEEIVAKIKSDTSPENLYHVNYLLTAGIESLERTKGKTDKKPLFSEQNLRQIAEVLARAILRKENEYELLESIAYVESLEKILPARAAQIKQKIAAKNAQETTQQSRVDAPPPPPPPARSSGGAESREREVMENLQNLGAKELPAEERQKIILQARKMIAEIEDRSAKLLALSGLATQIAKAGDRELAAEIMNEAEGLINTQPKNYRDFLETWMAAAGYAQVDPAKAFPLLEDAILRLNDTISAFVKVGEFIDVNGDIIEGGEVQVGSFGGEMTRELLRNLGATDTTILSLAKADFSRTKALAESFDRTEVRILAKMLVLRAVLAEDEGKIEVKTVLQ